MPTYEFRLPDGTIIEKAFRISEVPDEIPNPNGEGTAVRIISRGGGLVFKGSGFYLTDYGRNAHRTQGDAPKPAGGESSGDSGSSDTAAKKPDAAAATASERKPAPETKAAPASKSETKPSGSGPAES